MRNSLQRRSLLLAAVIFAAAPVTFGVIRAVTTGSDRRYLWVAGAAVVGSMAAMPPWRMTPRAARVSLLRGLGAVVAGSVCAAATAVLMGTTLGPGLAIVASGFGICTGTSAVFAALAHDTGPSWQRAGRTWSS